MPALAIVTVASNNYLHFARRLLHNARRHHPHAQCYCVMVDADHAPARALSEEFETVTLDQPNLPGGDDVVLQTTR